MATIVAEYISSKMDLQIDKTNVLNMHKFSITWQYNLKA